MLVFTKPIIVERHHEKYLSKHFNEVMLIATVVYKGSECNIDIKVFIKSIDTCGSV